MQSLAVSRSEGTLMSLIRRLTTSGGRRNFVTASVGSYCSGA